MRKRILSGCLAIVAAGVMVARAQSTGETVITSERLTYDYQRSTAVFEGNVDVVDPQLRMKADKVNVIFDGTNSVKSVAAVGNVRLWYQDKTGTCKKALYLARTGEVVLEGDAVLNSGTDSVRSEEITFWLNDDRVTCQGEQGVRMIIHPQNRDRSGIDFKRKVR